MFIPSAENSHLGLLAILYSVYVLIIPRWPHVQYILQTWGPPITESHPEDLLYIHKVRIYCTIVRCISSPIPTLYSTTYSTRPTVRHMINHTPAHLCQSHNLNTSIHPCAYNPRTSPPAQVKSNQAQSSQVKPGQYVRTTHSTKIGCQTFGSIPTTSTNQSYYSVAQHH